MEILDPDLWNDDGTPKKPTKEYMQRLEEAQRDAGCDACAGMLAGMCTQCGTRVEPNEANDTYLNYARIKREAKERRSPEVGDIVHAWDAEKGCCRAAIVMETMAFSDDAEIRVHIPHESFQDWAAEHDESKESTVNDSWHWPCGERQ